ncbi:hypothetical protein DM01DRAFT_1334110 [Hesseltinella vesiculosa]|uniref:DNA polymerase V n=1 Tax=Hesseltinella vesiculosa TaxID=101127 RepID=A0A1X2GMY6_9FUNG|nr:hypothetical protein DM01DRAFT_1334110 [Hesseltinella vesiculosa]
MATTTLQLYWDLASLDASIRQQATIKLIRTLASFQLEHEKTLNETSLVASTEEQLDKYCATDVAYAVRRLIRGLPSSRQGARQGFSLALTELLSIMDCLTINLVLDLLTRYTDLHESSNNEETRDLLFGRLFGLMAIVASGLLTRSTTTTDDIARMLKDLAEVAKAKVFLNEVAYHVIINMLPYIAQRDEQDKAQIIDQIKTLFFAEDIHTVDQVNLALALQQNFADVDLTEAFKGWASTNVFDKENLAHLAVVVSEMKMEERDKQVDWTPALHCIWDRLLDLVLNSESQRFADFWSVVVDNNLFNMQSSHGRRFWGFQVFNKVLPRLSSQQIPMVFTENFMRALMNNLSSDVRLLNKVARQTALTIEKVAADNSQVGFALVTQLVGKNGHQRFDSVTRTKTVENILATMDNKGLTSYLSYLAGLFTTKAIDGDDTGRALELQREWALHQMVSLINNHKLPKDEAWIQQVIRFVLVYTFFDITPTKSKKQQDPLTHLQPVDLPASTRAICQKKFESLVLALSKLPPIDKLDLKTSRWNGTTKDGQLWAHIVYDTYQQCVRDKKHFTASSPSASTEEQGSWDRAVKVAAEAHKQQEPGFEILLYHILLRGLIDQEEGLALLGDVLNCYDKLHPAKKTKKAAKKAADDEKDPEPIEVIVDILLSFLTSESPILKGIATHVFELFSSLMTKQAIENMIHIITTNENKDGGDELFGEDDDMEEASDDEDDDLEFDSDVEILDSDVEMIDGDNDDQVDEELRQQLEQAMREQGVLANEDDSDEELLGDDAMEAFDEKLAEIFRERKKDKQDPKSVQQSVVHFKNNVLELLGAFAKKNPSNPLLLDTIVPLLQVVQVTKTKATTTQFVNKVLAFLQHRLARSTEVPTKGYDEKDLISIVESVHQFAMDTTGGKAHHTMANQLLVYLRKCIVGSGSDVLLSTLDSRRKKLMQQYLDVYRHSLTAFLSKRSCHLNGPFFGLFQQTPLLAWTLMDCLVAHIPFGQCANVYRNAMDLQWAGYMIQHTVGKDHKALDQDFTDRLLPSLVKAVQEAIKACLDEPEGHSDAIKNLMKFIGIVERTRQKLNHSAKVWDTKLFTSLSQHKTLGTPSLVKATCKPLL